MLDKNLVEQVLLEASATGGDFAELFVEDTVSSSVSIGDKKIDAVNNINRFGAAVRIFKDDFYAYAFTNDLSREGLLKTASKAAESIRAEKLISRINLTNYEFENKHKVSVPLLRVSDTERAEILHKLSDFSYKESSYIKRVDASLDTKLQRVMIANTEGLRVNDERSYSRMVLSALAEDGDKTFSIGNVHGKMGGFEVISNFDLEAFAVQTTADAVEMLRAENCPTGRIPVVLKEGIGGTLFHEACGHSLEATAVAKKASVFAGRIGEKIASELVTLVDDGTLPNHWGSVNIDDEGTPTQRNVLIENGILKGYLVDKFNGRKMGMPSTGSGRRENYTFAPTSRMNNTFILAGKTEPDEIIASVKNGIYVTKISGGSVETASGNFNFSAAKAYKIENGKITVPVRGAKLIGSGEEILRNIDLVGNNLDIRGGGRCGSQSGWVPVCHGVPRLRISEMTVGGQK